MKPAFSDETCKTHTQTKAEDGSKSPAVSSLRTRTCLLMASMRIATLTRGVCNPRWFELVSVTGFVYWYHGVLRTQRRVNPASVRILMEAASASLTVSFTDCIRFWALCTNISVAWSGKHWEAVRGEITGARGHKKVATHIFGVALALYFHFLQLLYYSSEENTGLLFNKTNHKF